MHYKYKTPKYIREFTHVSAFQYALMLCTCSALIIFLILIQGFENQR
jgi:hypothetical protein